jgi:hypothetical protein
MERSESIGSIIKALSMFQNEVKQPKKNSKVDMQYKDKFGNMKRKNYNYASLDEVINCIKEPLSKNGLVYMQDVKTNDVVEVVTYLFHESGEFIKSSVMNFSITDTSPQGISSLITYARRYSLSALLGLASEEYADTEDKPPNEIGDKPPNEATPSPKPQEPKQSQSGQSLNPEFMKQNKESNKSSQKPNEHGKNDYIDTISMAQQKRLFALSGGNAELVKEISRSYGYERSKDIKKQDYDQICSEIESNNPPFDDNNSASSNSI